MIAYGHSTLDRPTRSSSPARDCASLDPTSCDARFHTGPSACVHTYLRSPSRQILQCDSSPAIPWTAHSPTLFGPARGASLSRVCRIPHLAPAKYKLGHACQFVLAPFPFDSLSSVQYYSLSSQQGEVEADMALGGWFLCGTEGVCDKDENLTFMIAEKAARKGLLSAEVAMGQVGMGGFKDIEAARMWYPLVSRARHGNTDVVERLVGLSQPSPQSLLRQEHDTVTESKLALGTQERWGADRALHKCHHRKDSFPTNIGTCWSTSVPTRQEGCHRLQGQTH